MIIYIWLTVLSVVVLLYALRTRSILINLATQDIETVQLVTNLIDKIADTYVPKKKLGMEKINGEWISVEIKKEVSNAD